MTIDLKRLQEQRAALAQAMHDLLEKAEAEERGFTDEERGKWDAMRLDIEALDARIELVREDRQRQAELEAPANLPAIEGISTSDEVDDFGMPRRARGKPAGTDPEAAYNEAFMAMMRSEEPGVSGLSSEHRKLLRSHAVIESRTSPQATTPGSAGGFLIPTTMVRTILETMKAYGGIRSYANVISTTAGEEMQWPTNDDTGNEGELVGENQQVGETEFVFGQRTLHAYKYSSKIVRISIELLQDSAFGLDQFVARKFGQRLGRITSRHYATGTGSNQPQGLMTKAKVGHTGSSETEVTYADFLRLKHSIDPAYRASGNGRWVMNDKLLLKCKEMLDGNNRPLWKPSMADGSPSLIDSDPYVIDQGVAEPAAGQIALGYGDISEFLIRDVLGFSMHRLIEKYIDYGQIGFLAFMRTDSDLMDLEAFKTLKMKGTAARSSGKVE